MTTSAGQTPTQHTIKYQSMAEGRVLRNYNTDKKNGKMTIKP